jgi:hypothetical protein
MKTRIGQKRSIFSKTENILFKACVTGQMKNLQFLKNMIPRVSFQKSESMNKSNESKKEKNRKKNSVELTCHEK